MSKRGYSLVYSLFFVLTMVFGGVSFIGPVSFRHIIVVIMLLVNLFVCKFMYKDKFISIYFIFVLFYFICSFFTGHISAAIERILSYYFVCYIAYCSTILLITRYRNEKLLFYLIIGLGIVNAVVTVGQFVHNPVASQIADYLNLADSEYLEEIEGRSVIASYFYMPGICGVVYNGYLTMVVSILSAKFQAGRFSIIGFLISVVLLISCFMVQERSSFALGLLLTLYLILWSTISNLKKKKPGAARVFFIIFIVLAAYAMYNGFQVMMSGESRMAMVGMESGREDIYNSVWSYIVENPLLPGIERFVEIHKTYPHNLFFNAYVYAGPVGFIMITILIVKMFSRALPFFFRSISKDNSLLITFCFCFLAYNVNSLVHNNSLVTGDMLLWIIWGGIYALTKRGLEEKKSFPERRTL